MICISKKNESNLNREANRLDDEIFTAHFRKQVHEYFRHDLHSGLKEIEIPPFSETGDKKIQKMIKQAIRKENNKQRIKRFSRVAVIILIVLAVCSITMMSVDALRVPFLNFFVNTEEKATDIDLEDSKADVQDNSISDLFGYIPDGYELTSEEIQDKVASIIYTNDNKDSIFIDRYLGEGSISVDTENAQYGKYCINDESGFYTIKNGITTVILTKSGYTYSIYGDVNLEEMVKILENIK